MGNLIDLTGQQFGYLTVLKRSDLKRSEAYWTCQCQCGAIKDISSTALRRGATVSCGCFNKKNAQRLGISNKNDLVGQQFGRLTVIEDTNKRTLYRSVIWKCQCQCGNFIEVAANNLVSGNTTSCGCLISYGEQFIQEILEKYNIDFKKQYSFPDLKDHKPLKFDFAVFKNKILYKLIEYDGRQHFDQSSLFYSDTMKQHDQSKTDYCITHNIPLLRLKFEDLNESLLERIMQ